MVVVLGIESTAHTFGIGVVKDGKVLANVREMYTTEEGGIIPMDSAKHHAEVADNVYERAIEEAKIDESEIDAIAFSQGPGLAPCLLEGMKFSKELARKLARIDDSKQASPSFSQKNTIKQITISKRDASIKSGAKQIENIPLIPVNHCVAHLEIGRITGAKDPVMLYASGANTQVIAYEAGKYRVFGETLDVGVGNFIDNFARFLGLGFPGGPAIQKLAEGGKEYVELPYKVKGMDVALSGILTNLKQKVERMNQSSASPTTAPKLVVHSRSQIDKTDNEKGFVNNKNNRAERGDIPYTKEDLAFSMQETVFAMLVETAERALAHTGKKELLLGGGVACNSRLQEMCKIMCEERGAKFFVPERPLLVDNGAFIAFTGELMYKKGIFTKPKNLDTIDIYPRQRTDQVDVNWK